MPRAMFLFISLLAYLIFFATFLYLVAFIGDFPWVPRTVDRGGVSGPLVAAITIDLLLVALFGLQHSIMARPAFKRLWTKVVPGPIERSVYVLSASLTLMTLFLLWCPISGTIWSASNNIASTALWGLFALGWLIVLLSTFMISHFELFGVTQAWAHVRRKPLVEPAFRTPFFYRIVRHPLYSGFILAFFAIPNMTAGHFLLAAAMLAYILIAIQYEERDLIALFGDRYTQYRGSVGMITPRLLRSGKSFEHTPSRDKTRVRGASGRSGRRKVGR